MVAPQPVPHNVMFLSISPPRQEIPPTEGQVVEHKFYLETMLAALWFDSPPIIIWPKKEKEKDQLI